MGGACADDRGESSTGNTTSSSSKLNAYAYMKEKLKINGLMYAQFFMYCKVHDGNISTVPLDIANNVYMCMCCLP